MDDQLYREVLLDHARCPRYDGAIEGATFVRHEANASCGDMLDLFAIVDQDGLILSIGCVATGCVISRAAASMFAEWARGKTLDEVVRYDVATIPEAFGIAVGPMRMRCATLAVVAFFNGAQVWKASLT